MVIVEIVFDMCFASTYLCREISLPSRLNKDKSAIHKDESNYKSVFFLISAS